MIQSNSQLSSLSRLAVRLRTTPGAILDVTRAHGIAPAVMLDEAPYFNERAAAKLGRILSRPMGTLPPGRRGR